MDEYLFRRPLARRRRSLPKTYSFRRPWSTLVSVRTMSGSTESALRRMDGGCQHENRVAASSETTWREDNRSLLRLGWRPLLEPIIAGVDDPSGKFRAECLSSTQTNESYPCDDKNTLQPIRRATASRLSALRDYRRISYLYLSLLGASTLLSLDCMISSACLRASSASLCSAARFFRFARPAA